MAAAHAFSSEGGRRKRNPLLSLRSLSDLHARPVSQDGDKREEGRVGVNLEYISPGEKKEKNLSAHAG